MKIEMAKNSGFCMGVRKAILKIVDELNSSDEKIFMYGPLIHNPQTIEVLKNRGLVIINSLENLGDKQVAIRTHGIPVDENKKIRSDAKRTINLTCSRVARVQSIIKKYSGEGYFTIIIGDRDHAEVTGLKSYARSGVHVISDRDDIKGIPDADKYLIVSQTTHERGQFEQFVDAISGKYKDVFVIDTICDSTRLRQDDVINGIKKGIDTLVVVGGKNSANTSRLLKLGEDHGVKAFHVETDAELKSEDFRKSRYVLVTAGASTPGWIINNVLEKLYMIKNESGNIIINKLTRYLELLIRSNILSSISSFFMVLFAQSYAGIQTDIRYGIVSICYIFVMYSVNNYLDREFLIKSNSYKYKIYEKHGLKFLILSILLFLISLRVAVSISLPVFFIILVPYIFGIIYSTNFVKLVIKKIRFNPLTKLYNAKVVTGFGWLVPVLILPYYNFSVDWYIYISAGIFLYLFLFLRNLIIEFVAFQGDLILGRDSLPTLFGIRKSLIFTLFTSIAGLTVFTFISLMNGKIEYLLFAVTIVYYLALLKKIGKKDYLISLRYEIAADFNYLILSFLIILIIIL